ncbi:MAG: (deoxy)nucleoside triphosphate pyrophosphohydrolase [Clostridia bacterium]|nr:(deoxy)nucleoside triphosphate pyrophosphohydrolase [Clostridia bacterium]
MIAVTAALAARNGRLLIARRPDGRHMGGRWEFPGGKLEKGELPEDALKRELREELGVEAEIGPIRAAIPYSYPEKDVLLLFYSARLKGEPRPIDEAALEWVSIGELADYDLAPVDALIAERLTQDDISDAILYF